MSIVSLIDSYTKDLVNYDTVVDSNGIVVDGFIYREKDGKLYVNCDFTAGKPINIKIFGVKGDGVTDDSMNIQKAFDIIESLGGGHLFIPNSTGDYILSDQVKVGSNTTVTWEGKSFFRLIHYSTVGTVICNKANAENIVLNNPLIDGANITAGGTGENGISFGKCKNVRVYGGIVKNCRKGTEAYKLGGKGIQVESEDCEDVVIKDVSIYDSDWALSTQININGSLLPVQVVYTGIKIFNCGRILYCHQINGFEDSKNHLVKLENITAYNCGDDDDEGLIVLDRAKYLIINNMFVKGTKKVKSLFRGRHSDCVFTGIVLNQNVENLIYNKPSFSAVSYNLSTSNFYDITVLSSVDNVLNSSIDGTYSYRELRGSYINVNLSSDVLSELVVSQSAYLDCILSVFCLGKGIKGNTTFFASQDSKKVSLFKYGNIENNISYDSALNKPVYYNGSQWMDFSNNPIV